MWVNLPEATMKTDCNYRPTWVFQPVAVAGRVVRLWQGGVCVYRVRLCDSFVSHQSVHQGSSILNVSMYNCVKLGGC